MKYQSQLQETPVGYSKLRDGKIRLAHLFNVFMAFSNSDLFGIFSVKIRPINFYGLLPELLFLNLVIAVSLFSYRFIEVPSKNLILNQRTKPQVAVSLGRDFFIRFLKRDVFHS